MSRKQAENQAVQAEEEGHEEAFSDGWLSWVLLIFFLLLCLLTWWLVHRKALQGAPAAPLGVVRSVEQDQGIAGFCGGEFTAAARCQQARCPI